MQNGCEGEVMELRNSLTFGGFYGGTAAQRRRCPILGTDNGDYCFPPVFYGNTTVFGEISPFFLNFFKNFHFFEEKWIFCLPRLLNIMESRDTIIVYHLSLFRDRCLFIQRKSTLPSFFLLDTQDKTTEIWRYENNGDNTRGYKRL